MLFTLDLRIYLAPFLLLWDTKFSPGLYNTQYQKEENKTLRKSIDKWLKVFASKLSMCLCVCKCLPFLTFYLQCWTGMKMNNDWMHQILNTGNISNTLLFSYVSISICWPPDLLLYHWNASLFFFTVLHENSNCSIFISNVFAAFILQSLPTRYIRHTGQEWSQNLLASQGCVVYVRARYMWRSTISDCNVDRTLMIDWTLFHFCVHLSVRRHTF